MMFVIVLVLPFSPPVSQDKTTELAIQRLQYLYQLKRLMEPAWPMFGDDRYNIPILYFAGDTTFVANPHEKFIRLFQPERIFHKGDITIYRLDHRIDTAKLQMQVSVTFADSTVYNYREPYMKCNSREEFIKITEFIPDELGWAAMIMHEFFHGFQILHAPYQEYLYQNNLTIQGATDAMQGLFMSQVWYTDMVNVENDLLVKAIASGQEEEIYRFITEFFAVRDERRSRIDAGPDFDFGQQERSFETLEGTARFMEFYLLSNARQNKEIRGIFLKMGEDYLPDVTQTTEGLSKTTEGHYYYATGYNMTCLLKKLKIDYTSVLFNQPVVTLEDLLRNNWQTYNNKKK